LFAHGRRFDQDEERPISAADVRYVECPYPFIYHTRNENLGMKVVV
jgi:hypothetical protein